MDSRTRRDRGQALVELALILPVAILFLGAVLDLGRVFYAQITVTNAAREGAFQASRTPDAFVPGQDCTTATTTSNRVVCRVQLEARGGIVTIPASRISMDCSTPLCAATRGSTVTVTVTGEMDLLLLHFLAPDGRLDLGASAIAQIEYLPTPPVPTPAPTPTPSATASATPSATPSPTPSATPSPTPGTCTVPAFIGRRRNDAQGMWTASGFTSAVTLQSGNGNYWINYQSLAAGATRPCTAAVIVGP